jgi:hypothetical protein
MKVSRMNSDMFSVKKSYGTQGPIKSVALENGMKI